MAVWRGEGTLYAFVTHPTTDHVRGVSPSVDWCQTTQSSILHMDHIKADWESTIDDSLLRMQESSDELSFAAQVL
jgi:hypothetical protein